VVLLWAIVTPALALDWEFEYVDTVGIWSSPSLRVSGTGVLHFCYRAPGNRIVHSWSDGFWHHEEVGPFEALATYRVDAGANGEFGLLLCLSTDNVWLYERQDTSWRRDSVAAPVGFFSYDSAGVPSGVFRVGDTILYARRAESTWVSETVAGAPVAHSYYPYDLIYTVRGEPCAVVYDFDYGNMFKYVLLYIEQADTWRQYYAASGGRRSTLGYVGCAPDTGGGAAVLYNYRDEVQPTWFRLSGYGTVDSGASAGAVAVHGSGVPHVAYIRNQLRYACRVGTTWYRDTIFAASSLQLAGIVLEDSLPIVGFIDPATGVWVARRQPVGVQEQVLVRSIRSVQPTLARGMLYLQEAAGRQLQATGLLDITGRRVLDLHPGANDVRALTPGVYFIREGGGSREQGGAGIRKVVLTR